MVYCRVWSENNYCNYNFELSDCSAEMELANARRTRTQLSTDEEMASTSGSNFPGSNFYGSSNAENSKLCVRTSFYQISILDWLNTF